MNRSKISEREVDEVKARILREVIPEIQELEFKETEVGTIKTQAKINGRVKTKSREHFAPFEAKLVISNKDSKVCRDFFGLMHQPAKGIRISIKEAGKSAEFNYELRSIFMERRHYTETHSRWVGHVRAGQEIGPYSYAASDYDEYEDYQVPKIGSFEANENVDRKLSDMETFNRVYGLLKYSNAEGAQALLKYFAKRFPKESKVAEDALVLKFEVIAKAQRERLSALEELSTKSPRASVVNN